jgi:hypothetical protein
MMSLIGTPLYLISMVSLVIAYFLIGDFHLIV